MNEDSLKRLTEMAQLMKQQTALVEIAEADLAAKKANLLRTRREDIPELMSELGLEKITLATGETISVKEDVSASIPVARRAEAIAWLEANGFGGIVKTRLAVQYNRGERDQAIEDAKSIAETFHHQVSLEEDVHSQTLRAFIREQLALGHVVPFDLFGVHPYSEAKIEQKR